MKEITRSEPRTLSGSMVSSGKKKRGKSLGARERRFAFWLILPTILGLCAILLYPSLQTITWSFQHYILTDPLQHNFTLSNYTQLIHDHVFWLALKFTLFYAILSVLGQTLVGLGVALMANREFRGRGLFRAALLFPWMMPTVITAVVWRFMYDPNYGLFNGVLQRLGLPHSFVWLGSPTLAVIALFLVAIWKVNSFAALVFLAGLQSIPASVYEAADVDGATAWQRFTRITMPMLRPTILVVLVLRTVEALQAFDIIYGLTLGGPGYSTLNLPLYLYQQAIQGLNFGYGSAMGVILAIMISAFAFLYVKVLYRPESLG
ncbi:MULTISPECIES: sugar ABC transporter permease [Acidithrix]|uniref:Trehalose transport system permease protein SugA n=1 Tax=Acidithrix ferrooxidans TaxID=1280514 RepID=A0A0D8HFZ5_9ACTN|nr:MULTISPECIES: sugar ABC transporter permease [Acidithrix]KJF16828.1 trehalose transport system permease protein SugA [Acidithrix ferrooxidans]